MPVIKMVKRVADRHKENFHRLLSLRACLFLARKSKNFAFWSIFF
jgi:hypothetical protein